MPNYIILSLKHSAKNKPCFWRADDAGYTNFLVSAGIYSEEKVKLDSDYYNDGRATLAIPITEEGFQSIGLKTTIDLTKVKELIKEVKS